MSDGSKVRRDGGRMKRENGAPSIKVPVRVLAAGTTGQDSCNCGWQVASHDTPRSQADGGYLGVPIMTDTLSPLSLNP